LARSRYEVLADSTTYFATSAVVNWLPLFSKPDLAKVVFDSLEFLHAQRRLVLHAYVLLENHLHLVGTSSSFSKEMKNFKSYTARGIVNSLKETGSKFYLEQLRLLKDPDKKDQNYQVWQEGFHPQAILSDHMLRQKIEYIHYNPVRRGYVDQAEQWRYSSARQYAGEQGLSAIEPLY